MVGRLSELVTELAAGTRLSAEDAAQAFRVLSGPKGLDGIKGEDGAHDGVNGPDFSWGAREDHHWVDSDSDSLELAAAGLIPPRQLLMLMDYMRRLWLTADPNGPRSENDEIGRRLKWLKDVGNAITGTPQNQDIVSALQAETWAGLSNYTSNLDAFGNPRHYVPLLSLKTLSDNLNAAIKALADIEPTANDL